MPASLPGRLLTHVSDGPRAVGAGRWNFQHWCPHALQESCHKGLGSFLFYLLLHLILPYGLKASTFYLSHTSMISKHLAKEWKWLQSSRCLAGMMTDIKHLEPSGWLTYFFFCFHQMYVNIALVKGKRITGALFKV